MVQLNTTSKGKPMESSASSTVNFTTYYAHCEGTTYISFSKDGRKIFTAGADGLIRSFEAHSAVSRSKEVVTVDCHTEPVTALLTTKDGLITGSEDKTIVKNDIHPPHSTLYKFTQATTPIRQLAVQPFPPGLRTGDRPFLAVATDKLLEVSLIILGTNLVMKLAGLRHPAVAIAFHPEGRTLMALTNQGALVLWDVTNLDRTRDTTRHPLLHSEDQLARCSRPDKEDPPCPIAYHPLGKFVAVPSYRPGEILLLSSQDLSVARTLTQGHQQPVCGCAWTPNGQFLATTALDRQLGVWRVDDWSLCLSTKLESNLTHLAWSPTHNLLAAGNEDGSLVIFEEILNPSHGLSPADWAYIPYTVADQDPLPHEMGAAPPTPQANVLTLNAKEITSAVLSPTPRPDFTPQNLQELVTPSPRPPPIPTFEPPPLPQLPFQPGSQSVPDSIDKLMSASSIGTLTLTCGEKYIYTIKFRDPTTSIDYTFQSDTRYDLGSLGRSGVVLASSLPPNQPDSSLFGDDIENRAQLLYRPHGSHESKDSWEVSLEEGEDIVTVAATSSGPVVTTSLGYHRHFSLGGIQFGVTMAPSPTMIATAYHNQTLFHAFHITMEPGRLRLGYRIYQLRTKSTLTQGTLTLSPTANLTWIGFTEEGLPILSDSQGLVQILSSLSPQATWRPVSQLDSERHLPISAKGEVITCLLLEPHWFTNLNDTEVPWSLLPAQTLFDHPEIEGQYLLARLTRDVTPTDPSTLLHRHTVEDKLLLRLLYKACQSDHPRQAWEMALLLNLPDSLDYAEQIALRTQHLDVVRKIDHLRKNWKSRS